MTAGSAATGAVTGTGAAMSSAATPVADERIAPETEVFHVDALGSSVLWVRRDTDDQYRVALATAGGPARDLSPQSFDDLDAKLGADSSGRLVVAYRRCTEDGQCGLYRLELGSGRETPLATHRPNGCTDDHPVVARSRVVFGRTCTGPVGSGVFALKGDKVRRILRLDGDRVTAIDSDGAQVAAVASDARASTVRVARIDGSRAATIFTSAAQAGIDVTLGSLTIASGTVTWMYHGEGENTTDGAIYRARAKRGATCTREYRRFSTDLTHGTLSPAELMGVGVGSGGLYYGVTQSGIFRAVKPAVAFAAVGCRLAG